MMRQADTDGSGIPDEILSGKYDDGLLLALLAKRGASFAEIGRRVGLSRQAVWDIYRAKYRKDLQTRLVALRSLLPEGQRREPPGGSEAPPEPGGAEAAPLAGVPRRAVRRKKEYDDDLLVGLIASGRDGPKEIARRVGISASQISRIARGKARADLQARIAEGIKRRNEQALREGGKAASEAEASGEPRPPRRRTYDEELLVELLAQGDLTCTEIASRVGLAPSTVSRVSHGRIRKDLHRRVRERAVDCAQAARRKALGHMAELVDKHLEQGLAGDGHVARRCREWLMERLWDETAEAPSSETKGAGLRWPGLTETDFEALAILKDGPSHTDPEDWEQWCREIGEDPATFCHGLRNEVERDLDDYLWHGGVGTAVLTSAEENDDGADVQS
jgi:transcriptional regulator with XRE-family HTH domain